jgi:hypothetical protein
MLGCDGLEHLHQLITAAKIKTRSIQNPEARARATGHNLQMTQQTNKMRMAEDADKGEEQAAKKAKLA